MEVVGGVHHAHAAHQLVPLKTKREAVRPLLEILRLPTEAASIQATTELLDDLPQGSGVLLDGPQCFP